MSLTSMTRAALRECARKCSTLGAEHAAFGDQALLLTSVPAVGPIVALTYASAIDDPARFKSSKQAGAHFGSLVVRAAGAIPIRYSTGAIVYDG